MTIYRHPLFAPFLLCFLFFILYTVLSVLKHDHFLSGYDLGIVHQITWKYSQFKAPILTAHAYPFTSIFADHVEFIYILLSPLYWVIPDARTLVVLQNLSVAASGVAVWLLAKKKKVNTPIVMSLLISYLMFFGIQFALWSDVHSIVFGAGFLAWFLYFLETENKKWTLVFLLLTIACKEDLALLTLLISGVYFLRTRKKDVLLYAAISIVYLFLIFFIYFPYFTSDGYRFSDNQGLLANIRAEEMFDTPAKREVFLYGLLSYGFLPLLAPLYLIPAIGDLAHYFVLGSECVDNAQGLFGHYRVTLALLLIWPTILAIAKYKKLNTWYIAVYLLSCALIVQYVLHLPLSYLSKAWFWKESQSVQSIQKMLVFLPKDASVATQVNIIPHISGRDAVFILWPGKKTFTQHSPCGKPSCTWLSWAGQPKYLLVDTASDWDIRHLLSDREQFISAVSNIEKEKIISPYKKAGTTTLYKVVKNQK